MSKIIEMLLEFLNSAPEEWACPCAANEEYPDPHCQLCRGTGQTPIPPKEWKNVILYENGTRIDFDTKAGTLYAKKPTEKIINSEEAPNDGFLIINYNILSQAVGAQIINAEELSEKMWDTHPDKDILSVEIKTAIKHWIHAKDSGLIIKQAYFSNSQPGGKWQ